MALGSIRDCKTGRPVARTLRIRPGAAIFHAFSLLLLAMAAAVCLVHAAKADEYLLGAQDKVRLKVYEWRASRDEIFEWKALNDDFVVGADGTLSLPFAGKVSAAGMSPTELANKVSIALMRNMGLGRSPDVSAEIVQFRPFYIVGDVEKPGEYPYRPEMNVLQAVSIGGGLRRGDQATRVEREVISGRGELALQQVTRAGLLARKSRLEAEMKDADTVSFPEELTKRADDHSIAALMDQEKSIFDARREGLQTQVRALEELRDFLGKSVTSLEAHLEYQDRQVALSQKEMENVAALAKKGFAAEARQMEAERSLVQAQSDRLSAETSLMRAQQEKSRTEISIIELNIDRKNEVRAQLRETVATLGELAQKSATTVQLLRESESQAPQAAARLDSGDTTAPVYTIVRAGGSGTPEKFVAGESEPVRPGDVLEVKIPLDGNGPGLGGAGSVTGSDLTYDMEAQGPKPDIR